jgi:hypothetical protein
MHMAIPPEPIEQLIAQAALVIEAVVEAVISTGQIQPKSTAAPGTSDTGKKTASQVVKLKITKVHKGPAGLKEVVAEKPLGAYALRAGNKGPFLLDDSKPNPVILGRYGPDSYRLDKILGALKSAK